MTLNYYSKNVYGNEMYYLANAEDANAWYQLTGKKTLTKADMQNLKTLDSSFEFVRVFEAEA
jgi:hypothetical protein